jgi:hypothetical protein
MTRSLWEAGNGLISGYKKAEELARKKVVSEFKKLKYFLVVFLPYPTSLPGGDRRKLGW